MNRSENIAELATALAKAQAVMAHAVKDHTAKLEKDGRRLYEYRYATLAGVLDVCREPLSANGLSIIQTVTQGDGRVTVTTMLLHASGQYVTGDTSVPLVESKAQAVGSAISYARRYGLTALVGVATDDDDAGEAQRSVSKPAGEPNTLAKVIAANTPAPPPASEMLTTDRMAELDGITDADGLREWCGRLGAWYLDLQGEDKEAVRALLTKVSTRLKVNGPAVKGWLEGKEQ